ncbi:MAG: hypothetical protein RL723_811, partial [Actinomycetota bacterium]
CDAKQRPCVRNMRENQPPAQHAKTNLSVGEGHEAAGGGVFKGLDQQKMPGTPGYAHDQQAGPHGGVVDGRPHPGLAMGRNALAPRGKGYRQPLGQF